MIPRWPWAVPLIAMTLGCGPSEEPVGKRWYGYDYTPEFGATFSYMQPTGTTTIDATGDLHMFIGNGSWDLKMGADYATGTDFATWTVDYETDVGLFVDGSLILPDAFVEGDSFDNGTVDAIAEKEVAIGTYDEAITVTVDTGTLAGEAAFVVGTGPIVLTIDGTRWEVVQYERANR